MTASSWVTSKWVKPFQASAGDWFFVVVVEEGRETKSVRLRWSELDAREAVDG